MANSLLRDSRFAKGFFLLEPKDGARVVADRLHFGKEAATPVWDLSQWHSKYNLKNEKPIQLASRGVCFSNSAKRVVVAPEGSEDADLVLALNGDVEYGHRAPGKGEPWPHLLASQDLEDCPNLTDMSALHFKISARLRRGDSLHSRLDFWPFQKDYRPTRHAALFQVYFTVQNLRQGSPGFGDDYYWFGLSLYDDRKRLPGPYASQDTGSSKKLGTQKFIFKPDARLFGAKSLHDQKWVTYEKDLLPLMWEGLDEVWRRNYLQQSRDPNLFSLGGISLGWEVTGLFDVEMQVRDLSLEAS